MNFFVWINWTFQSVFFFPKFLHFKKRDQFWNSLIVTFKKWRIDGSFLNEWTSLSKIIKKISFFPSDVFDQIPKFFKIAFFVIYLFRIVFHRSSSSRRWWWWKPIRRWWWWWWTRRWPFEQQLRSTLRGTHRIKRKKSFSSSLRVLCILFSLHASVFSSSIVKSAAVGICFFFIHFFDTVFINMYRWVCTQPASPAQHEEKSSWSAPIQ